MNLWENTSNLYALLNGGKGIVVFIYYVANKEWINKWPSQKI